MTDRPDDKPAMPAECCTELGTEDDWLDEPCGEFAQLIVYIFCIAVAVMLFNVIVWWSK